MHEYTLLDHLSNYHKQLMSIDRRVSIATSGPGDTTIHKRHRTNWPKKRPAGVKEDTHLGVATQGSGVAKARAKSTRRRVQPPRFYDPQKKLPMQELKEISSALCDIHMILTHLVGIEMTQHTGLRCQAEGLEDIAFLTVNGLADVALLVVKRKSTPKEVSDFEDHHKHVSMILLRDGPDSETQKRRKRLLEKRNAGCDELAQTLGGLSIEHKAVEDKMPCDELAQTLGGLSIEHKAVEDKAARDLM